jgi:predicted phage terminase large subunit-like protein
MSKKTDDPAFVLLTDYYKFFQWCWPIISQEVFISNWHIKTIARRLQYLGMCIVNREKPDSLTNLFSVPPGSTKSSLISQCWIIWLWLFDPSIKMMNVSYAAGASIKNSFAAKQIFKSEEFQTIFGPLLKTMHGKSIELIRDLTDNWENNFGGQFFATSVTGQATSFHFNVIVFDDPQNAEIADSDTKREASNRSHDFTFPSRKMQPEITPVLYVGQRFHELDTLGHVMAKDEPYYYLCLPAEISDRVSPTEMKDYYIDGLLNPVRHSKEILKKYKSDLGSFAYAGQYLQNPYPEEGGHVKKEWFMYMDESEIPEGIAWDLWIDGAYTEKSTNDPSGFMVCGFDFINNRIIVKYCTSQWLVIPDVIKRVKEIMTEHGNQASMIYIEPKASGYSFIQLILKETFYNVTRIVGRLVQDGKMARVKYASPKVESSRVWIVKGNWNNEFVTQLTAFPNYKNDEYADLLGYSIKKYFG